jgi:hypothetical protein
MDSIKFEEQGLSINDLTIIKEWCLKNIKKSFVLFKFGTVVVYSKEVDQTTSEISFSLDKHYIPKRRIADSESHSRYKNEVKKCLERRNIELPDKEKTIYFKSINYLLNIGYPQPGIGPISDKFITLIEKDNIFKCEWPMFNFTFNLFQFKEYDINSPAEIGNFFGQYGLRMDLMFLNPYYIHSDGINTTINPFDKNIYSNQEIMRNRDFRRGTVHFSSVRI